MLQPSAAVKVCPAEYSVPSGPRHTAGDGVDTVVVTGHAIRVQIAWPELVHELHE